MDEISDNSLECLNSWPEGTAGYDIDAELISIINLLCKQHGYGRVPQIAASIEDLWRHPEKLVEYQAAHDERMNLIKPLIEERRNKS